MSARPVAYLAGPMRGYPLFNFPAFDQCRDYLIACGWKPVSPADMDREQKNFDPTDPNFDPATAYDFDIADALRRDFDAIADCEAIVFLPGWEASRGANAERMLGQALDIDAYLYDPTQDPADRITRVSWQQLEDRFLREHYGNLDTGDTVPVEEYRVTDENTGGQKGQKDVQLSMVPWPWLEDLGRVYAMGAKKYDRHNWRKGYAWSLSIDAAFRHFLSWLQGEDLDPESGVSHLAHLAWHTATLHTFEREGLGTDDR